MNILDQIQWLGQSTVKISVRDILIYVDPYLIAETDKADYIFITHSHYDHLSADDIRKVATKNTRFYAPYNCIPKLMDLGYNKVIGLEPGHKEDLEDFKFEAVPAYNIRKVNFHPRNNKWVGYIFEIDNQRVYHAGDTERIPEMKDLECDVAMLPLGQTYTMNTVEDAAASALDVKAKMAIPIHYGLYEGTNEDALKFKDLLKDKVKVVLAKQG